MKRLHGLAMAIAIATAPAVAIAQEYPDDSTAPADEASVAYDGGQNIDSMGRRIDADEHWDAGDDSRSEDSRYDDGVDERDRYAYDHPDGDGYRDERYRDDRDDGRYESRYDHPRYDGDCRRKADHASPVLGFLLGGLIGNQFGHGGGRAAMTIVGAHLGHEIARDAVNTCEDRYSRGYRGSIGYGVGYGHHRYHSGYSLFFGYAPYDYGFGNPSGGYWDYRFRARPWRWHRGY